MNNLLINDEHIKSMSEKKNDDFNVKKLLNNFELTQSQSIRFGKVFESFVKNLVKSKNLKLINEELVDVFNTGSKTNKGKKDIDICFIKDDTIFYFECKINLKLDSEKSKVTDDKVCNITNFLINENKSSKVFSGILTGWYERENGMPTHLKTNVVFMSELFSILGIETTKEEYYKLMNDFGKLI